MSGRKRISKWDLPQSSTENGNIPHDGRSDRNSSGSLGNNDVKGSFMESNDVKGSFMESNDVRRHYSSRPHKEPFSESRHSDRDGIRNRAGMKDSESLTEWDGDGSYSMRMSPGLEEWRKRSRSPRSRRSRSVRSRSRSQSRSPPRGFKHEAGGNDRGKSRSGLSTQPCRDFLAGRCRRGDDCHFLHQSNRNFEDRRYTEDNSPDGYESRHKRDGTSKYSSNNDTKEIPYRAGRLIREREDESNDRDSSFERGGGWREPRRTSDIPCKFFTAGNCRNGEGCRFAHYIRSGTSSDSKSRDDRLSKDYKSDYPDQSRDTKYNRTASADGATWNGPKWNGEKPRNQDGPTWSEETCRNQDGPTWNEEKHRNQGVSESRSRASPWSKDDQQDHNLENNMTFGGPGNFEKAVKTNGKEYFPLKSDNTDPSRGAIGSKDTDNTWLGDMEMSPEWNYTVQATNDVSNDKYGYANRSSQSIHLQETSLPSTSKDHVIQDVLGQMQHAASATKQNIIENVFVQHYPRLKNDIAFPYNSMNVTGNSSGSNNNLPGQSPCQNGQSSTVPPHSDISPVAQSQHGLTLDPPRGGSNQSSLHLASAFQDEKPINRPNMLDTSASQITSEFPIVQPTVSTEQLAQLSNISASLAQLFGSQQQIPQLYAALNTPKATENFPSLSQSTEPVPHPMTAIILQKPYDPKSDSNEQMKLGVTTPPPLFSPNSIGQKMISDIKPQKPYCGNELLKQSEQATIDDGKGNNEKLPEESKKVGGTKKPGEDIPLDNTDEGKKSKDVKGLRVFKFALVEFIKELLKPSWKDGKIDKDGYKIIVKKVIDKVTGTIQAANIPQTQEKIDQYLSSSKPKLTKLVQAYVEKHQKS